jgi:hypothetical protein
MNILETVLSARNGGSVREISQRFGLSDEQTAGALAALMPALASGFSRNLQSEGGLASLASALQSGRHERYLDDPSALNDPTTIADGNSILGHVLGSKQASRDVASRAAAQTGLSDTVLKQLLPIAAAMMMGSMARQRGQTGAQAGAGGGDLLSMLSPMLDQNRNGSIMDDVGGILGRFLGSR